jgi:hypothetical protein
MHQIAVAGDRLDRNAERLEDVRPGGGRRWDRNRLGVVLVVDQPNRDPARLRGADRVSDAVADRARQADVVERELERVAGGLYEADDARGDVLGLLTTVGQLDEL